MVVYSLVEIRGRTFTRAVSDKSLKIRSEEGRIYNDAIYPSSDAHTFTETEDPIECDVAEEDKDAALRRFGMEVTDNG